MPSFREDMPLYAGVILLQQGSAKYQMLQFKQQMRREATHGLHNLCRKGKYGVQR